MSAGKLFQMAVAFMGFIRRFSFLLWTSEIDRFVTVNVLRQKIFK